MMQEQTLVEVEPIYEAQELLSKALVEAHHEKLLELYKQYHKPKNSNLDKISMGERRLKNICLVHLSALDREEVVALAKKQYWESSTMGDRVMALDIIENSTAHHSNEALMDFYEKYRENTLVMNKYLAILASSKREGLLQRVVALQESDVYDEKVPNLVRSLFGTFMANNKYFHAKDGSGYAFMAQKLIEIDAINAQIASRLAGGFKLYERMNEENKVQMGKALGRVLESEGTSKNLYEIVAKILKVV
jgi:aminopeptidase N